MLEIGTAGKALPACCLLLAFASAPVWAQSDGNDGTSTGEPVKATIRLMGDAADSLPGAVTKEITLPENLSENSAAAVNGQTGRDTANRNRLEGNEGIAQAEAASEKGAAMAEAASEKGAAMADAAQDNREARGRSGDRPDPPGPPETPGPGRP